MESERAYYAELNRVNTRILKALESVKGKVFVDEVKLYMEECEMYGALAITKKTVGKYQQEDFESFSGAWINQYVNGGMTGDDFQGSIYIKIKEGKYLSFTYAM